jgi:hypothetical protein
MPQSPEIKPQRRTLVVLLLLFFVPLATSFVLYYGFDWRPAGGANHGELLQPLRKLPALARDLETKWALMYVGDGRCDEACRHALYVARQTHVLLNKDQDRVNRTFFATSACCDREFLEREHEGIQVLDVSSEPARAELLAVLPPGDHSHHIFVVDPMLNVVLRFDTRDNPKGLLDDIKKLLKLSHIG